MVPQKKTYHFSYRKLEAELDSNAEGGFVELVDDEIRGDQNIVDRVYRAAEKKYGQIEIMGSIISEDGINVFE